MANIKRFNEALTPKQYRPFHKEAEKVNYQERYKHIFDLYAEKHEGNRNSYRIYLPLIDKKEKSDIQIKIEDFIDNMGIDVDDPNQFNYREGKYKFPESKNWISIGRALSKAKNNELMNGFASDKTRVFSNNKSDLLVCISRHPYDVVGADTDRRWINCMTLYHYNRFAEAWLASGDNTRYLKNDVKLGSLIAYLIRKDDKNLQDPLSNINIKPYINDADPNDFVFIPDNRIYGIADSKFKDTVFSWCEEVNGEREGRYKISKGLYQDNRSRSGDDLGDDDDNDPDFGYAKNYFPKK